MIHLKTISKTYSDQAITFHALTSVDLKIENGTICGIFGESGAGKSTLLRTINLLERPTSGEVWVNGTDLTSLSAEKLRQARHHIGMIFQHFNLLDSRTAFENIALPLELLHETPRTIKERVNALLTLVGLSDKSAHYPEQLSGGQKQRVAIARALATEPAILLCDEPTSALDNESKQSILNLLKEINAKLGVTIVIITHEMSVIKQICTHAAVIDHGKLIECGSVLQLFTQPASPITKKLVQHSLHIQLPPSLERELKTEKINTESLIVCFKFIGNESSRPLISNLIQKHGITVNIIQANIENIQDANIGFTVCQLSGTEKAIHEALDDAAKASVSTEIIGYV